MKELVVRNVQAFSMQEAQLDAYRTHEHLYGGADAVRAVRLQGDVRESIYTRWAITHRADIGRTLAFANQGRNHYMTRAEAEEALVALRPDLEQKMGMKGLAVREVETYEHGDAKGIYFYDLEDPRDDV
jgi:hypothetical protein